MTVATATSAPPFSLTVEQIHGRRSIDDTSDEEPLSKIYRIINEYLFTTPYPGLTLNQQILPQRLLFPPGKVKYIRQQQHEVFFSVIYRERKSIVIVDMAKNGAMTQLHTKEPYAPGFGNPFMVHVGNDIWSIHKISAVSTYPMKVFLQMWEIRNVNQLVGTKFFDIADVESAHFFDYHEKTNQLVAIGKNSVYNQITICSDLTRKCKRRHYRIIGREIFHVEIKDRRTLYAVTSKGIVYYDYSTSTLLTDFSFEFESPRCVVSAPIIIVHLEAKRTLRTFDWTATRYNTALIPLEEQMYIFGAIKEGFWAMTLSSDNGCALSLRDHDTRISPLLDLTPSSPVARFNSHGDTLLLLQNDLEGCVTTLSFVDLNPYRKVKKT